MNETTFQVVISYFREFHMSPVGSYTLCTSLWATENKGNFISIYQPFTHLKSWSLHVFCFLNLFQLNIPGCVFTFTKISVTGIKDTMIFKNKWLYNYLPFSFKQCGTKHMGSSIKFCHIQTPYEFLILSHVFLRLQYMVKIR